MRTSAPDKSELSLDPAPDLFTEGLAALSPRSRAILQDRIFGGLSYRQIAEGHAITGQRARQLTVDAVNTLKTTFSLYANPESGRDPTELAAFASFLENLQLSKFAPHERPGTRMRKNDQAGPRVGGTFTAEAAGDTKPKAVIPGRTGYMTDQWLLGLVKWQIEKEGFVRNGISDAPVYFKIENDWVNSGLTWNTISNKRHAAGQTSVNNFLVLHGYPRPPVIRDDIPSPPPKPTPGLNNVTDHWLKTFAKWHIEKEGFCPHSRTATPVYFKLSDSDWIDTGLTWDGLNKDRLDAQQISLDHFLIVNKLLAQPSQLAAALSHP